MVSSEPSTNYLSSECYWRDAMVSSEPCTNYLSSECYWRDAVVTEEEDRKNNNTLLFVAIPIMSWSIDNAERHITVKTSKDKSKKDKELRSEYKVCLS